MKSMSLGLKEALRLTLDRIRPLSEEKVGLVDAVGRAVASDLYGLIDSPSMNSSLKDGYAVRSVDVTEAHEGNPVLLEIVGTIAAGGEEDIEVRPGTTVKVLTGARIPAGADAVIAEELVGRKGNGISVKVKLKPGQNVLARGADVASGRCMISAGQEITPVTAGLLAAAGHSIVPVFARPSVGIVGTGDEIVEPGRPLSEGKLYASNIVTLAGWCSKYRMKNRTVIVKDEPVAMRNAISTLCAETDALITSGGAWLGDFDLVAYVLEELGWEKVFHRIRIGPGKPVGFGILNGKPLFILAGGPPSNLIGFLEIALPGLCALAGHGEPGLPRINVRLGEELKESQPDWTDFFFGTLEAGDDLPIFHPMEKRIRLSSIARAAALAAIPEGQDYIAAGSVIQVQVLA